MAQGEHSSERLAILDTFVVASVLTVAAIRIFLVVTGFPSMGGAFFHIAHVLWGGAGLTAALLISLLAKEPKRQLIAILGGLGFGFFIDEIGKFVTRANDYFYRDAFLLMYLSLLLLWSAARLIIVRSERLSFFSPAEWPRRTVAKAIILGWCLVQTLGTAVLLAFATAGQLTELPAAAHIALVLLAAHSVFALVAVFSYPRNPIRSGKLLRYATLAHLLFVVPAFFFDYPFAALIGAGIDVAIIIGLSKVSFATLFRRLVVHR